MPSTDDIQKAAEASKVSPWTTRQKLARIIWMLVGQPVFRVTFHNWYALRRSILRLFGAKIGHRCTIRPSAKIEIPWNLEIGDYSSIGDHARIYNLGPITIGHRCSISQYAHLCAGTHDFTDPSLPLLRPPITVHDDAWIAAEAFVGPGVTVGEGVVLGARACLYKDAEPWKIYVGNPAKPLRDRPRTTTNND